MLIRQWYVKRGDALCLAAILVLATIFLAPALRPGYTLLPLGLESGIAPWHKQVSQQTQNPLLSDPFYQYYPFRNLIAQSLRQGNLILWNPYIFAGQPMLGDVVAQTFYPPNILGAWLFPLARAWVFLIWGHLGLTGLLMYAYLRHMALRPVCALFGASAWMLNAVIVVWLETPCFLASVAWLPGIFWLLSIGAKKRRWPAIAGAGVMYGMLVLAGQMQYAIGSAWLIGVWAAFQSVSRSIRYRRAELWPVIAAAVAGGLGVGIGMIQLAPALEFIQFSQRVNTDMWGHAGWLLRHAITLWLPDFYGNPVRSPWWGDGNIAEMSAYFGLWPFILSLCALAWSRRPDGRFWGGMLFLILLVLWGTPAAYLLRWLPGIRYVTPTRLLWFMPFAGGIAAAFALHAAQDRIKSPRCIWPALAIVLALLAAVSIATILPQWEQVIEHGAYLWPQIGGVALFLTAGLAGWRLMRRRPLWGAAALVLISSADLIMWGMPFNPVNALDILYPANAVTDWLRQDTGLHRVLPLQSDRIVFGPNVLSMFGLQEPGGYSSQIIRRYRDLVRAINDKVDVWWMAPNPNMLVNSEFDPLFSMLNVKYVLSSYQRAERVTVEVAPGGCISSIPLHSGDTVTQDFQVANPGLNRLDVRFSPTHNPGRASLRFRLWRDRADGELVADIPFEAASISPEGLAVFFFQPVPDSLGETFVWGIEATDLDEDSDLSLCQTGAGQALSFGAYSTQLRYVDVIQGVWIYENPNALPRAYVSHHAEAVTDEEALRRLRQKDFDPWHTVLLASPLTPELEALTETSPLSSVSPADVIEYTPHHVVVDVQVAEPGVLVLSDAWYPGWRATVDGQEAEVLRVNHALRGVYVDGGAHRVRFQFRPLSLYLGAAITCAALATAVLMAWRCQRRQVTHREARGR
jgi:hypothetical protein